MVVYAGGAQHLYSLYPVGGVGEHAFACNGLPFEQCNIQFLQDGRVTSAVLPGLGAIGLTCN